MIDPSDPNVSSLQYGQSLLDRAENLARKKQIKESQRKVRENILNAATSGLSAIVKQKWNAFERDNSAQKIQLNQIHNNVQSIYDMQEAINTTYDGDASAYFADEIYNYLVGQKDTSEFKKMFPYADLSGTGHAYLRKKANELGDSREEEWNELVTFAEKVPESEEELIANWDYYKQSQVPTSVGNWVVRGISQMFDGKTREEFEAEQKAYRQNLFNEGGAFANYGEFDKQYKSFLKSNPLIADDLMESFQKSHNQLNGIEVKSVQIVKPDETILYKLERSVYNSIESDIKTYGSPEKAIEFFKSQDKTPDAVANAKISMSQYEDIIKSISNVDKSTFLVGDAVIRARQDKNNFFFDDESQPEGFLIDSLIPDSIEYREEVSTNRRGELVTQKVGYGEYINRKTGQVYIKRIPVGNAYGAINTGVTTEIESFTYEPATQTELDLIKNTVVNDLIESGDMRFIDANGEEQTIRFKEDILIGDDQQLDDKIFQLEYTDKSNRKEIVNPGTIGTLINQIHLVRGKHMFRYDKFKDFEMFFDQFSDEQKAVAAGNILLKRHVDNHQSTIGKVVPAGIDTNLSLMDYVIALNNQFMTQGQTIYGNDINAFTNILLSASNPDYGQSKAELFNSVFKSGLFYVGKKADDESDEDYNKRGQADLQYIQAIRTAIFKDNVPDRFNDDVLRAKIGFVPMSLTPAPTPTPAPGPTPTPAPGPAPTPASPFVLKPFNYSIKTNKNYKDRVNQVQQLSDYLIDLGFTQGKFGKNTKIGTNLTSPRAKNSKVIYEALQSLVDDKSKDFAIKGFGSVEAYMADALGIDKSLYMKPGKRPTQKIVDKQLARDLIAETLGI